MRVTRAAQRAQQDIEEEHVKGLEANERALKDIEPNTSPVAPIEEPLPVKTPAKTPAKKGKGKGKKGTKSKKATTEEEEVAQVIEGGEGQAAESLVDEVAKHGPTQEHLDGSTQVLSEGEQSKVPQTPAARLTRRQLAKLEEEALSKSQCAPSAQTAEDKAEDVIEEVVEQAEAATEAEVDAPSEEERETLPTQDEPIGFKLDTASKPERRTRRQQTKSEKQPPEEPVAEDTTDNATEHPEAPVKVVELVEDQRPSAMEQEPELAPKPARLTRRQQAMLEEKQHIAQSELTDEEILDVGQTEPQVEVEVAAKEEIVSEDDAHKTGDKMDDLEPVVAAELSSSQNEAESRDQHEPSAAVETETLDENNLIEVQPIESQSSQRTEIEDIAQEIVEARPATPTEEEFETNFIMQVDSAVPEKVKTSVEVASEAEPKMLHAEKPFEGAESTPTKHQRSTRRTSRSSSRSPMRLEESISAIDRLEEDLESIGKAIPDVDHSDDERSPRKPQSPDLSAKSTVRGKTPATAPAKPSARTPATVRTKSTGSTTAKASVPVGAPAGARASIAPKPPTTAKAAVPTRISRAPHAAPRSVKPTTTSLARASSVRTAPSKDGRKPSTETADYLASKRRPISLSFPTPPPPPKGRAPTKPTFQLSSDSVAAKLKAQREERMKREAEGATAPKQRPISMPPPPKSTRPPTVPSFQLPGEATAARLKTLKEERLKRMEEAGGAGKPTSQSISMPPPPKSTKQLTKPSFQLPGEATAARLKAQKEERLRRMEEAEAAKKAAAAAPVRRPITHRPRESLLVKDTPSISIPPPPQSDAPQRSTSLASKRSSIAGISASRSTSTSSANRNSILLAEGGKSRVTPVDAAALKLKGKQVFNRDRLEKEAMEQERRDKEEAAKKARAEAAERGRIASREWAERQRKKTMMMDQ